MSATTPGLLEPRPDADATAKRIHPFFAPQPRWRISKTTDRSKIALLRLPAEVRLLIYDHVIIIRGVIDKITPRQRSNMAADHVHWYTRAAIADAFNLMQTCKTVYQEARQIFWGQNVFTIHASPPFGVWPRPDIPAGDMSTFFGLTTEWKWKITLAVESAESQKMIRALLWVFPKDPWYRSFGQWRERVSAAVQFNGSDIVPSNLSNVQELYVILDAELSKRANYPTPDEVDGLVKQGILSPKLLDRLDCDSNRQRIQGAEVFTNATTMSLHYLTKTVFQKTQTVFFIGEDRLSTLHQSWYRMRIRPLPPDCLYLKRVRQALADQPLRIGSFVFRSYGRCVICLAEWTDDHWAEWNELQICPELGHVEAD